MDELEEIRAKRLADLQSLAEQQALRKTTKPVHLTDANFDSETALGGVALVDLWAAWCGPCLRELPLFEKLGQDRKDVNVILVSMDMDLDPDSLKVIKFVSRKKILSSVVILNERDPNKWIARIDPGWTGALPATLIVNADSGKRVFAEHELQPGDLEKLIEEVR